MSPARIQGLKEPEPDLQMQLRACAGLSHRKPPKEPTQRQASTDRVWTVWEPQWRLTGAFWRGRTAEWLEYQGNTRGLQDTAQSQQHKSIWHETHDYGKSVHICVQCQEDGIVGAIWKSDYQGARLKHSLGSKCVNLHNRETQSGWTAVLLLPRTPLWDGLKCICLLHLKRREMISTLSRNISIMKWELKNLPQIIWFLLARLASFFFFLKEETKKKPWLLANEARF